MIYPIFIFLIPRLIFSFQGVSPNSDTLDTSNFIQKVDLQNEDSLTIKTKPKSSLDTLVFFKAQDSIKINLKSKTMKLIEKADLKMGSRNLQAKYIEIDFNKSTLDAYPGVDTNGIEYGFPLMIDNEEEFMGERIRFNFKTDKGVITQGETELDEGFYYGKKIKKVNKEDFFIQEGYYTPCDELEPSTYFGSEQMKLENNNKIYMDPIVFYIQDLPFLVYPFGLFFSTQSGRRSGLVVPSYDFSDARGVVLEDFGFYWAASEYWDTKFLADYYTKGGYLFSNSTQWKNGNTLNGKINVEYGKTRRNTNESFANAYNFNFDNSWKVNPYQQFSADLRFASNNFNQNTQSSIGRRVQQNIRSNASYNINLLKWGNISTGYNRDQNIITDEYTQSPKFSYSLPNKRLFSIYGNDFNLSGSTGLDYTHEKLINTESINVNEDSTYVDTNFRFRESGKITLRPTISFNLPKIYHIAITPSVSTGMNLYNRKLTKNYFSENDSIAESLQYGIFSEYWYNYNVAFQTTIYGISNPNIGKIKSIRHTFQPTVTYRFRPDQSGNGYGFYNSFVDSAGREISYNVFEKDGGGGSSRREEQTLIYSLNNKVEIKLDQGDTLEAKKLELMNFSLNGNYNFTADSLNLSDVSFNIRTPALKIINLSGGGNFSFYDQDPTFDDDGNITSYNNVDRLFYSSGKGLVRLTSIRIGINTSFSNEGISLDKVDPIVDQTLPDTLNVAEKQLGSRFAQRRNLKANSFDKYGDSSPGWNSISIPWNISMGVNYSYNRSSPIQKSESVNANFSVGIEPAEGWLINGSFNIDLLERELLTPNINISKDLGCWGMNFTWVPTGVHKHFRFSIGLNAAQLKDFMYEKTTSNYY
ncbi:putative LPS assembly protein LptD [Candidatus Kapabacteria bacterium]|nr:putative LPS assembly protein LptD [Candidatus Kapabacteria bacterium]